MVKFFKWLRDAFLSFFRLDGGTKEEEKESQKRREENLPKEVTPELPRSHSLEEVFDHKKVIWYPERVRPLPDLRMSTRGYYQKGGPRGAVIHTTAGRSRNSAQGGPRNAPSERGQGVRSIEYYVDNTPFCFILIDRAGNVYQTFPLDRWGYHAGESSYQGLDGRVDTELVGIELMNAGKLEPLGEGCCKAWFTDTSKGDKIFGPDEWMCWADTENIKKGYYHLVSMEQKSALVDVLLWMNSRIPNFDLDYVLGHDEVSPDRKSDPGGSLDMTMPEFREMVRTIEKEENKKRVAK